MELEKPSYSIAEAARLLNFSRYRIKMMIELKQLKAIGAGKQRVILKHDLAKYFSLKAK